MQVSDFISTLHTRESIDVYVLLSSQPCSPIISTSVSLSCTKTCAHTYIICRFYLSSWICDCVIVLNFNVVDLSFHVSISEENKVRRRKKGDGYTFSEAELEWSSIVDKIEIFNTMGVCHLLTQGFTVDLPRLHKIKLHEIIIKTNLTS